MFASIYIADFPVEAIVRAEPLLRERAVAVLEGKPPLVRVVALNEKARLLGMEVGITKLQAAVFADTGSRGNTKGRLPQCGTNSDIPLHQDFAILRQRSPEQEIAAHAALLDIAHAFTPRVEDTAPDTLLLDLAGLERLYGPPATMATDLATRVIGIGLEANIAVTANPDTAMYAARGFKGVTVIPVGGEARRLGVLPMQILLDGSAILGRKLAPKSEAGQEKLREQILDTLERWGVRDFRTLALLPEHALASRLGETGVQLRRLARGEGVRTLVLCEPPSRFEEAMELESPVETIESLSFVLNRLLEQLCARLEARTLAANALRLCLQLERRVGDGETTTVDEFAGSSPQSFETTSQVEAQAFRPANIATPGAGFSPVDIFERTLRLLVAMRDVKVFLKLLQLELAAHPPGAPVTKIWITAEPTPPRSAQRGLFLPVTPEAEKLEITLARINALVGERHAGIARLLDSHRQDNFRVERFTVAAEDIKQALTQWDASPSLAMRLFRPARQLHVHLVEGRPDSLAPEANERKQTELQGKVLWAAGPWRSSGDWWTENTRKNNQDEENPQQTGPWDREEWDIALTQCNDNSAHDSECNVALYRIYRDLASGGWFADASYD